MVGKQIYSATYSNVPVFEFVTDEGPIMRRKLDAWINATHILKIAKFPKAKRTRILEKDVQTGIHEKVQGGYGKYQGTYIPLNLGIELAKSFGVYEELKPIFDFEYVEGKSVTPPPAPKHNHASASNVATRSNSGLEPATAKKSKSTTSISEPPRKRGRPKRVTLNQQQDPPKLKYNDTTPIQGNSHVAKLPRQDTETDALNVMANNLQHNQNRTPKNNYSAQFHPGSQQLHSQVKHDDLEAVDNSSDDLNDDNDEEFISGRELFGTPRNSFERIVNHHNNSFQSQYATPQIRHHPFQLHHLGGPYPHSHSANAYSIGSTPNSQSSHMPNLGGTNDPYGLSQYHHPQQNNQLQSFRDDQIYSEYFNNLLNFFLEDNNNNSQSNTNGNSTLNKDSNSNGSGNNTNKMKNHTVIPKELANPPQPIGKININQPIDSEGNTIFHWACSMANYTIIDFLINNFPGIINSNLKNHNGETPLMFLIKFSNSYQLKNFPNLLDLLFDSALLVDNYNKTVLHHIALSAAPPPHPITDGSFSGSNDEQQLQNYIKNKERIARYYIECLFAKIIEFQEYNSDDSNSNELIKRFINHQDSDGNTAFHLVAYNLNKKLIKIFISYHKFLNFGIKNLVNYTAEEYLASHNYVLKLEPDNEDNETENDNDSPNKTNGNDALAATGKGKDNNSSRMADDADDDDSPTKITAYSKSFNMRSFESQLYYSKMTVNLTSSTSNLVTEKLTELQFLIDKELNEKDEKLLKLINVNNKFQSLKLIEQKLILKIFKLDYLIKDTATSLEEIDLKRDKIIQDEISRFLNDMTFQVLQKQEKLIKKIQSYKMNYLKLVNLKLNQDSSTDQGTEMASNQEDLKHKVELAIQLQQEIIKSHDLMERLFHLQPMVPVLNKDDFKENRTTTLPTDEPGEEGLTGSVIASYPADDKLNKYCKLISLCCGMNINEVESSIDSIELSLMRSVNQK